MALKNASISKIQICFIYCNFLKFKNFYNFSTLFGIFFYFSLVFFYFNFCLLINNYNIFLFLIEIAYFSLKLFILATLAYFIDLIILSKRFLLSFQRLFFCIFGKLL